MKRVHSQWGLMLVMAMAACILIPAMQPLAAQEANPCTSDFKKICSYVTPGGGRLVACYEQNKDKMSAGCRAWAEGAKAGASVLGRACAAEIGQACNIEKGDPLAMINCLQGQYLSLSPGCVQQLNQFKYQYPDITNPPPGK